MYFVNVPKMEENTVPEGVTTQNLYINYIAGNLFQFKDHRLLEYYKLIRHTVYIPFAQ